RTYALDGLELRVAPGEIHGVLGPNGAGKTTMVRVFATLVRFDTGTVRICGYDVVRQPEQGRTRIALTGQFAAVDELLTGRQNLLLFARLLRLPARVARRRVDELVEQFDLTEVADRTATQYSGGMRRRLDLAVSLLRPPRVLFLDEPTTGLDPRSRNRLWEAIRGVVAAGTTVLLTTQYLEEADQLATGSRWSTTAGWSLTARPISSSRAPAAIGSTSRCGIGVGSGPPPTSCEGSARRSPRSTRTCGGSACRWPTGSPR